MDERQILVQQLLELSRRIQLFFAEDEVSEDIEIDHLLEQRRELIYQMKQATIDKGTPVPEAENLLAANRTLLAVVNQKKSHLEQLMAMHNRVASLKKTYQQLQMLRGESLLVDRTL